jgi:formate dehydrogenase major subunit
MPLKGLSCIAFRSAAHRSGQGVKTCLLNKFKDIFVSGKPVSTGERIMSENSFTLNGMNVVFEPGQTILEASEAVGVPIPTLCHLKGTTPTGACRICLVEIEGARNLVESCSMPVTAGMVVKTDSPRVIAARKMNIELLLSAGNHNCLAMEMDVDQWTDFQLQVHDYEDKGQMCPAWGDCRLQDLAIEYGVKNVRFTPATDFPPIESVNPLIVRDFSRCILCGRCVKACNEVQVNLAISHGYRGDKSKIVTKGDRPLRDSDCVFCGECVQACPVGALIEKKAMGQWRPWAVEKIRTTCPYCGVGCQQWLHVQNGTIVKVTGVEGAEPNKGRLCVKGRFGYDFIYSEERLKTPLIRESDHFREASWDEALDLVADRFKKIIEEDGPDAVAGVSCARSINEDSYQMQKLFREVFGTNNIDHCART